MTFICYPKCTTCQKARKWLDESQIDYDLRDIKLENPTYAELSAWYQRSGLPLKKLFTETFVLNKAEVTEMIARGYDATKRTLEIVFKNGTQDVDFIRSVSALLDKGEPKNYRVTGDIVVRNLYKVTKQIAKRKVLL